MWTLNHNESNLSERHHAHPSHDPAVKLLKNLSIGQAVEKLRGYTSFVFVRDPIVRFISGYMGKIRSQKLDSEKFMATARNYCFNFELPGKSNEANRFKISSYSF